MNIIQRLFHHHTGSVIRSGPIGGEVIQELQCECGQRFARIVPVSDKPRAVNVDWAKFYLDNVEMLRNK